MRLARLSIPIRNEQPRRSTRLTSVVWSGVLKSRATTRKASVSLLQPSLLEKRGLFYAATGCSVYK